MGAVLLLSETILRGQSQQTLEPRESHALRHRGLRFSVEPQRPSDAAATQESGLSRHKSYRGLAVMGFTDSQMGQSTGRGGRLHTFRFWPGGAEQRIAELRYATL